MKWKGIFRLMTKKELNRLVGNNIRKYRLIYNAINNTKITQATLAKEVGVSTPLIGQLESNKSSQGLSLYHLYRISEFLNIPIEKFFETD